jgi:hypothetical protein
MGKCKICNDDYHHCSSCDHEWYDGYGVCSEDCAYKSEWFKKITNKVEELHLTQPQINGLRNLLEDVSDEEVLKAINYILERDYA